MMRVAIVSGSRADRGALIAVKEALELAGVAVQWLNVHAPRERADSRLDSAYGAAMACRWIARELNGRAIDLVMVHGDRYEILGVATAAFLLGLPVAHLGGGDITEGSQDDSLRHAITKLSHLHFVTCADSALRVIQLGEHPSRIFNVGDPGIDILFNDQDYHSREEVLDFIGLSLKKYFLVAYHPNTLGDTKGELKALTTALKQARKEMPEVGLVLLDPNKDAGHLLIENTFKRMANRSVKYCVDLPRGMYLSLLTHSLALIGNSSAAFYEAPSTGTPVINLGDRQKGREPAKNHIVTATNADQLFAAMLKVYKKPPKFSEVKNPYGSGNAANKIADILLGIDLKSLTRKTFSNMPHGLGGTKWFINNFNKGD